MGVFVLPFKNYSIKSSGNFNMAEKKKMSLVERFTIGSEKSEGYARSKLPSTRWALFWDIFKGRFGKICLTNLLMLIFFLPLLAIFMLHGMSISGMGAMGPFSQCFGVGYQPLLSLQGVAETIAFNADMSFYILIPVAVIVASVGVSGGAYVIRNMIWTEGIFVANDFWRGIKQNFLQILLTLTIYSIFFTAGLLSLSAIERMTAMGNVSAWFTIGKIVVIIALLVFTITALHMITMSVTYKLKFSSLLKNAMLFTVAMPFHNLFFCVMALIPILLIYVGGIISSIGYVSLVLFGFAFVLLVWTDFSHWAYDRYINDRVPGAKKNRGIYEKISENDSESLKQYRAQIASMGPSYLSSRPIKPITDEELQLEELPTSFSRNDIERLNESRRILYEDNEKYIEEHKNDEQYVAYKERFEKLAKETESEKISREKRIAKAKKELEKRNKKKKNSFID